MWYTLRVDNHVGYAGGLNEHSEYFSEAVAESFTSLVVGELTVAVCVPAPGAGAVGGFLVAQDSPDGSPRGVYDALHILLDRAGAVAVNFHWGVSFRG